MQQLETFPREEFIERRWAYEAGEHVTIVGPTGTGKTWLGLQLLAHTTRPKLPGLVLVMKPRDTTTERWYRQARYKRVQSWPPPPTLTWWERPPPGWVLWPRHTFDPARDDATLYAQFRAAILDSYKRGNRIVFADEAYGLTHDLDLDHELITLWTRGRSMGTGIWAASQRPAMIPLHAYGQASHLFLFRDPDKRARDRYSEISGVDPVMVRETVLKLGKHQCLYIRQDGPKMCIVDK